MEKDILRSVAPSSQKYGGIAADQNRRALWSAPVLTQFDIATDTEAGTDRIADGDDGS